MITHDDQMALFVLISRNLGKNLECFAFGGTAMIFYGYKDSTKDIDLIFEKEKDREEFIRTIKELGFSEASPFKIYIPEKLRDKNRPLMFKRGDIRFDLFARQIFRTKINPRMKEDLYAIHDFKESHTLKVKVLRKEHIVLLKSVTGDGKN